MANEMNYQEPSSPDLNFKIRDLESKQSLIKNRVLMIGQNLIDLKENSQEEIINIKKQLQEILIAVERMKKFLELASSEFPKFAKKEDLEILSKQAKMFQP